MNELLCIKGTHNNSSDTVLRVIRQNGDMAVLVLVLSKSKLSTPQNLSIWP